MEEDTKPMHAPGPHLRQFVSEHRRPRSLSVALAALVVLTIVATFGCRDSRSSPRFGLTSRVEVTGLQFPGLAPNVTPLNAVAAFPNLSFTDTTFLTAPPDGTDRICVVEKVGRVHVFPNVDTVSSSDVLLDITDRVESDASEEGLLGLAFDPDFATNRYFYVHYTDHSPRRSVIARFRVSAGDPSYADPATESILLEIDQPFANHNGGMLAFGADGMLYASIGDGGSGGDPFDHGQDRTTLLGTVLRLQPTPGGGYAIPADNPFVGVGGGVREEIYAYGLRHPWRFSFDRTTDDLWLGDVGQGEREEINVIDSGDNLGWKVFEGTRDFSNPGGLPLASFVSPIHEYDHDEGIAIIGGYVYRGPTLTSLTGAYIYGDFQAGRVWALEHTGFTATANTEIATVPDLVSFGEDESGELYAVGRYGDLYRFELSGPPPPTTFPGLLSETGLFADTATLEPTPGVIEYDVNAPLWSDGASKRRWLALPGLAQMEFDATGAWTFPVGTVLVKHFELELIVGDPTSRTRLETRVLLHTTSGWAGYTYRWNASETDAVLIDAAETETLTIQDADAPGGVRTQEWQYPSRAQCLECHTTAAGRVLGVNTRQLNGTFAYPTLDDNQLRSFDHIGLFTTRIGAASSYGAFVGLGDDGSIDERARSYLDTNCAFCHRPGGTAPTAIDLRFDATAAATTLIDVVPTAGDLGLAPPVAIVRPGAKESSVLWERLRTMDATRMPPVGSIELDAAAIEVIGAWIDSR